MEPAEKLEPQKPKQSVSAAPPVVPKNSSGRFKKLLARTSGAFTAEYSVFLILLGVSISNLTWLVYIFFSLLVDTMTGASMLAYAPVHMFALWLMVSSAVTLPLTYVLWSRAQGTLVATGDKGDLPKGAAKGFRTFWLILSALSIVGMVMAAIYAPIAAAISGGTVPQLLLSVTLPSVLGVTLSALGIYLVTRGTGERKRAQLIVLLIAALTVVLFVADYAWASGRHTSAPDRTRPSYDLPSNDYDEYDDLYDDPYYKYDLPSEYR